MSQDTEMTVSLPANTQPALPSKSQKSHTLFTTTIRSSPFAYAHLQLSTSSHSPADALDNLQVRSYCTAALRQFLGDHGAAIPVDILKVSNGGRECWLRLPRQDLAAFSSAITAFPGTTQEGVTMLLRLLACADWLGSLVGVDGERKVWGS